MSSQFFGLTIASSGLTTYQASLNTSANNISNVNTEGYSRQEAITQAAAAIRVNAKYGTAGTGVVTTAIKQIRDSYYDTKYWQNSSKLGMYEKRLYYMDQVQTYFADDDDSSTGFTTILNKLYSTLETLSDNPSSTDVRTTVLSSAQNLATYFNSMAEGLSNIQESCNEEIETSVATINAISQKVSILNKQINIIELSGGYANELRDQRALLIDQLSAIVPVEVEEVQVANSNDPDYYTGATNYRVKINGQILVDTFDYRTIDCVARDERVNQTDIDGLYDLKWSDTGMSFNAGASGMTGSLKALFDVRDGNNEENFSGTVSAATNNSVTIKNTNQSDITDLTINETGIITINNKEYNYTGFTRNVDSAGSVTYTFDLKTPITTEEAASIASKPAEIGDSIDYMGVPYYMSQMNSFLRSFCAKFNAVESSGVNLNGDTTDSFFTGGTDYKFGDDTISSSSDSYYKLTASNVQVNKDFMNDSSLMSTQTAEENTNGNVEACTIVDELEALWDDTSVFRGSTAGSFLTCLISDISISTQESETFYNNYSNISSTITNQRLSVSGVDEDEEALDLVKFQNAYNLASRMVQTLTEIYDRLILETGV